MSDTIEVRLVMRARRVKIDKVAGGFVVSSSAAWATDCECVVHISPEVIADPVAWRQLMPEELGSGFVYLDGLREALLALKDAELHVLGGRHSLPTPAVNSRLEDDEEEEESGMPGQG